MGGFRGLASLLPGRSREDRHHPQDNRTVGGNADLVRIAIAQANLGRFPQFLTSPFDGNLFWVEGETVADRATMLGFEAAGLEA